jgi:hypothetical protein
VDFFDFVFTRYLGITKNHMKIMRQQAPGHFFNRESMHFFDFVYTSFGHHQNSYKNRGAAPGHHFKIRRPA